jgi:uncharacterized membrane protein YczE
MKEQFKKLVNWMNLNKINMLIYISGFLLVGLGINLMDKSNLGLGAWDTVTFNIHAYLTQIVGFDKDTFLVGYVSAVISFSIMLAVLLYRKNIRFLFMLIPVLLMANVINFWYYIIFDSFELSLFIIRLLFFVFGVLIIPLGLSMVVKSTFPAFVFDEWTFMMSEILHIKSFAKTRLIIEITGVTIGAIFGYLTYFDNSIPLLEMTTPLGSVSIGTIIVAFLFGPIMQFYLKLLNVSKKERD